MQADARVFVNGEISYTKQLRDGSVANDIPHYVIRMSGLLRSFCNCFGIWNMSSALIIPRVHKISVNSVTLQRTRDFVRT